MFSYIHADDHIDWYHDPILSLAVKFTKNR